MRNHIRITCFPHDSHIAFLKLPVWAVSISNLVGYGAISLVIPHDFHMLFTWHSQITLSSDLNSPNRWMWKRIILALRASQMLVIWQVRYIVFKWPIQAVSILKILDAEGRSCLFHMPFKCSRSKFLNYLYHMLLT